MTFEQSAKESEGINHIVIGDKSIPNWDKASIYNHSIAGFKKGDQGSS